MIQGLLAVVAGALLPLAMAPFDLWPLSLISVAAWFHLLMRDEGRGLLLSWLYGVGMYGVGVSWIYVSIHEHGHAAPPLAALLVAIFVSGLALFPMLTGWLFSRVRSSSWLVSACWFAILLLGLEWLLTWFLTGFPWLAVGYAHVDTPLAAFAPVGGVRLVSAMAIVSGLGLLLWARVFLTGPGDAATGPEQRRALGFLALSLAPWIGAFLLAPVDWTESGSLRRAALVQGNVDQATKWLPENRLPIAAHYRRLSAPHWGVDLIVWPEAALTLFEHQAAELLAALDEQGRASGTGLVLGLPALEVRPGDEIVFQNAALALGAAEGRYVKRRLVPFGEYVPLESLLRGLITFFDLPMSHAEPGAWQQPPLELGEGSASMAICYEIVYPELSRTDVNLLLTISNDTWFGHSIGPRQHLAIARMRALENGRWLLRATNNGVTAIVDPRGEVTARLPQFEAGVLSGEFRLMSGRTPFNRLGDWPLHLLLVAAAAILLVRRARSAAGAI